jgi:hypothetical protein
MTIVTIPLTVYSVQSAAPLRIYGQLASIPLLDASAEAFLRGPITSKIPAGANVVSAKVQFRQRLAETGSRTLKIQPVSPAATWNSNVTWTVRPTLMTGTVTTLTKSSPLGNTLWEWTVTSNVQVIVSGNRADNGWRIVADSGNGEVMTLAGTTAATGQPVLVVEYTVTPDAPENLHPASGSVSIAKPVLTFDAAEDITNLQVQIDPAMDGVTPDFSHTEAASGGYLDLADTAYGGLGAGDTTYWRARQQTAGGWSAWSDWVSFSRTDFPTLTLVNPPTGAIDDGTPPVEWSYAGTQVAWQARIRDASGVVLANSGYTPGTATTWAPPKGFTRSGQTGDLEVRVWDDEERVATAGDPEYASVTLDLTYTLDPTVDPMDTIVAVPAPDGLGVLLTGTRAAGTPDEVVLFRDGANVSMTTGTDVFTGTVLDGLEDPLPPLGVPVEYRVAPRVGGKTAAGGPTVTIIPSAIGIWLIDADDTSSRVRMRTETGAPEQSQPEQAIVHTPLNKVDGLGQVVRRRLVRYRPQGTVTGVLVGDTAGEALLRAWAEEDAGHLYLLAFSGFSGTVIIGDLEFTERDNPRQAETREVGVKFNYWSQAAS